MTQPETYRGLMSALAAAQARYADECAAARNRYEEACAAAAGDAERAAEVAALTTAGVRAAAAVVQHRNRLRDSRSTTHRRFSAARL